MTEERKEICCTGRAAWPTIISIALNVFLVGVLVGPLLGGHGMERAPLAFNGQNPPPPPGGPGFMLERIARSLPSEEAQKFQAIFNEERKGFQHHQAEYRKVMRKIAAIMKAEVPDTVELRKVMDEIRASGQGLQDGMSRALERVMGEISVEGRRKIADVLEQDRGPDRGPDGPPPPPPPME